MVYKERVLILSPVVISIKKINLKRTFKFIRDVPLGENNAMLMLRVYLGIE